MNCIWIYLVFKLEVLNFDGNEIRKSFPIEVVSEAA